MGRSFTLNEKPASSPSQGRRKVLVTGAAGTIGSYFAQHSHQKYDLRLMDRQGDELAKKLKGMGEIIVGELADLEGLKKICAGIDTIVHMAGDPRPIAPWSDLLNANIIGTYHLFAAAKSAGVRRVIYASSIHAVSGHPVDFQVHSDDPVNPGDLYGVTKCFGEALARYMAEKEGVSAICLRIGAFTDEEAAASDHGISMLDAWISPRDMQQLIEKCIEADHLKFAIFNALSNNHFKRLDITDARQLVGYTPQDDLTQINPKLRSLQLNDKVQSHSIADGGKSGIRREAK